MSGPEMNAAKAMLERHGRWHEEHDAATEEMPREMVDEMRAVALRASVALHGSEDRAYAAADAWLMRHVRNPHMEQGSETNGGER